MDAGKVRSRLLHGAAVHDPDTASLEDFPLGWRWTSPRHLLLGPAEKPRLIPLAAARARTLDKEAQAKWPAGRAFAAGEDGESEVTLTTEPAEEKVVRDWLQRQLPPGAVPIFVSWQPTWAVLTDAVLFARHWPSFCYPASDDVLIVPPDLAWVLSFHHEGVFRFLGPSAGSPSR